MVINNLSTMVTSTAEQEQERRKKEREAGKLGELAADQRLAEERAKAEAEAEAEKWRSEDDVAANKCTRSEEGTMPTVDVTRDDNSTGEDVNEHIQEMNQGGRDADMNEPNSDDEDEEQ